MIRWTQHAARIATVAAVAGIAAGAALAAAPSPGLAETAGALLYSTHCAGCHTAQAHWRDRKLVTGWSSLDAQVRRWAGNLGLGWSDEDVAAVAEYLNNVYYRFPAANAGMGRPRGTPVAAAPAVARGAHASP